MANDAELAKRAAAGDREAAAEIYDRYAPLIRAILLDAAGSLPEANELLQEVFLLAFSRLGQLKQPESLSAWLIGIGAAKGANFADKPVAGDADLCLWLPRPSPRRRRTRTA